MRPQPHRSEAGTVRRRHNRTKCGFSKHTLAWRPLARDSAASEAANGAARAFSFNRRRGLDSDASVSSSAPGTPHDTTTQR